jgi:hypothetical protein
MSNAARKIFVQLGRAGDILNVLPLAWLEFMQAGRAPYFMVARAYADLLDGVSYVEPVVYEGDFENVLIALFQARQLTPHVILPQIYGKGIVNGQLCSSFARESWWAGGARVPWGSLPLLIDRRDASREAELVGRVTDQHSRKKIVLVATEGTSSPFPYRRLLLRELEKKLSTWHQIVDLSQVRSARFFDLLGLYEKAHCLVTIDTGHLHLAHASNVPVVALITRDPSPWHGSPWRPNHVWRFFYDEFPGCLDAVVEKVADARVLQEIPRKIVHVWADWREGDPSAELRGRTDVAQASWQTEYATGRWIPAEMKRADGKRSGLDIGDPHNVQYVHDVIEHGISKATKYSDVICLTNADIGFTPGLTGKIMEVIDRHGCAFSHRRDFPKIHRPFHSEAQVAAGDWYPGSDLFVFTVSWWHQHKHELPDLLMGREGWDEVFRQLVKYHAGGALLAACWHEWHVSFWCDKQRWTLPGNLHNFKLRKEWFERTGFVEEDFRYFRCVETGSTHPKPYPNEPNRAP